MVAITATKSELHFFKNAETAQLVTVYAEKTSNKVDAKFLKEIAIDPNGKSDAILALGLDSAPGPVLSERLVSTVISNSNESTFAIAVFLSLLSTTQKPLNLSCPN